MADITYDIDKLKKAKEAIDDLIDNLNDDNKKLTEALADLKAGWKTDTGTKFFDEHKDTWTEYVKKYAPVVVKSKNATKRQKRYARSIKRSVSGTLRAMKMVKNVSVSRVLERCRG